jgi:hypothetical protein
MSPRAAVGARARIRKPFFDEALDRSCDSWRFNGFEPSVRIQGDLGRRHMETAAPRVGRGGRVQAMGAAEVASVRESLLALAAALTAFGLVIVLALLLLALIAARAALLAATLAALLLLAALATLLLLATLAAAALALLILFAVLIIVSHVTLPHIFGLRPSG